MDRVAGRLKRPAGLATIVLTVALVTAATACLLASRNTDAPEGKDVATLATQRADREGVEAYFVRESYAPGATAKLVASGSRSGLTVQIFRAGTVPLVDRRRDEMRGTPVTTRMAYREEVRIGNWPSGLYFAELRARDGRVGYAPFVLRPRRLGEHRVAVVMPTNTWQAYNRRDADGDGTGDTWYEDHRFKTIDLTRPFLDRGVPPHFGHYDLPFLRWLQVTGKEVDVLAQLDLEAASGEALRRAYDVVVFPGHHEYVTTREYDVIERYRDLGGNLMFLSANNFFWQVVKRGGTMTRTKQWRDLGRPEAALIGVQYIGNDNGEHRGQYLVKRSDATDWVFTGTGLGPGSRFASFGIEIDHTAPSSPPGTQVIAEIPNLLGPGQTAQMTYYETPAGAKVFAAGAFTLGGAALWPAVSPVLENVWEKLTTEGPTLASARPPAAPL